jgi:hypothetical protein
MAPDRTQSPHGELLEWWPVGLVLFLGLVWLAVQAAV